MDVNAPRIAQAVREILLAIGEDPDSPELRGTPGRVAKAWAEFYGRQAEMEPARMTTFTLPSNHPEQMVAVSGMRVWSMCEHHMLPFWCDVSIGYISAGKVLGLSKFARIAHASAARLQLQERLVVDIANAVESATGSSDIAVIARGEHSCAMMRGARTPHVMTSSEMRGAFKDGPSARAEFLAIAGIGNGRAL